MCLPFTDRSLAKGEHAGFEWEIVHNGMGHRCGYVRVLPGHPWFEKPYDDVRVAGDEWPEVHGGLTFADHGKTCETHKGEDEWWLGFDCAHAGDLPDPELPHTRYPSVFRELSDAFFGGTSLGEAVRTQEYVEAECRRLCEQAASVVEATIG